MSWSNFLRKLNNGSNESIDTNSFCEFEHLDINNQDEKSKGMNFIPTLQVYTHKYDNKDIGEKEEDIINEINETVDQAHSIMEEATKRTEEIKNDANDIVNKMQKEASDKAFHKGFIEGQRKEAEKIKNKEIQLIELTKKLEIIRRDIFEKSQDQIMTLIFRLTEKIIRKEISLDRSIIVKNLNQVLKMILKDDKIKIRLNPEDLSYIKSIESKNDNSTLFTKGRNIQFISDPAISTGGCTAETDFGNINASIEGQLDELKKEITNGTQS